MDDSVTNHVETNHPEYSRLYDEATSFYREQFRSLDNVKATQITELLPELILVQFCMICFQSLTSAFHLLQRREFFNPLLIVRNELEYTITWAYIEKDPNDRANQYVNDGVRIQLRLTAAAQKHPDQMNPQHLNDLIRIEPQRKAEYEQAEKKFGPWLRSLEKKAEEAGILHVYDIGYRLFSIYSHPDSNTGDYFFDTLSSGTIGVHEYDKDTTATVLFTALMETNLLMSDMNSRLGLPASDKYDELRDKINSLPK